MPEISETVLMLATIVSIAVNIWLLADYMATPKVGTLHIEETPVGSIRYSLDVEAPLGDIPKYRQIVFDVEIKGDVS